MSHVTFVVFSALRSLCFIRNLEIIRIFIDSVGISIKMLRKIITIIVLAKANYSINVSMTFYGNVICHFKSQSDA